MSSEQPTSGAWGGRKGQVPSQKVFQVSEAGAPG